MKRILIPCGIAVLLSASPLAADHGVHRPDARKGQAVDTRGNPRPRDGGGPYPCSFRFAPAIGREPGVSRRDPSDVILADHTYYVWYSKVARKDRPWSYPSGYSADVFYATSPDGKNWTEEGIAVGKGEAGAWDEHGVFTPNILAADGRYWLFYTGVAKPFDENSKTAIGLAVADSPRGPWRKLETNPVLLPSDDPRNFDSMRVDDAALIVRGGRFWLYYKGRRLEHTPGETKMGVAVAEKPQGPYVKQPPGPLHAGHEVMVWPQGSGVASLATAAGPRRVYFAADGIHFQPRNPVSSAPGAPGCFRRDAFQESTTAEGISWGISHASRAGDVYLLRFDCVFVPGSGKTGKSAELQSPAAKR